MPPPVRVGPLVQFAGIAVMAVACATSANEAPLAQALACATASDCELPASACVLPACEAGACTTRSTPKGTPVSSDPLDECNVKESTCDGAGGVRSRVAPLTPGTPCTSGGRRCDGAGHCVACVDAHDCTGDASCVIGKCVPPPCTNGVKDGDETDVDCGGQCTHCAAGAACAVDADCASKACDPIARTCMTFTCADGRMDGDETDVDCGGSCGMCPLGATCAVDYDCASNACDAFSFRCVADQCVDNRKEGLETDVDCGGGICPQCTLGVGCLVNLDCTTNACDTLLSRCVRNQCEDHRIDGNESDVDCGGFYCSGCTVGQRCNSGFDCRPGLWCSTTMPRVCQ